MMRRIEQKLLRAYEFVSNAMYYWRIGHGLRQAIRLARDTIPVGR